MGIFHSDETSQLFQSFDFDFSHIAGHTGKNGAVSKVIKNLFLILHGHNIHCQQRKLSTFLMRYQQFASHAY
jgi:hypothetical protein